MMMQEMGASFPDNRSSRNSAPLTNPKESGVEVICGGSLERSQGLVFASTDYTL